ncbi:hypothetical protein E2C01_001946 [Portunus trituberculatus]|uniref:Uncharacterized protein n=1 Tax=Portunus trituberculatus TaxID=210409 RepID=A0A5B7CIH8_PORTR|nr:hypothetical protein [Portunus trituberculatus]
MIFGWKGLPATSLLFHWTRTSKIPTSCGLTWYSPSSCLRTLTRATLSGPSTVTCGSPSRPRPSTVKVRGVSTAPPSSPTPFTLANPDSPTSTVKGLSQRERLGMHPAGPCNTYPI